MLLIDTQLGQVVDDNELKMSTCRRVPFAQWITENMIRLENLKHFSESFPVHTAHMLPISPLAQDPRMKAAGFSLEQLNMLLLPMVTTLTCDSSHSLHDLDKGR
jgi:glutamate synthase (NADPH/NADH)